ncbi:hypothetical protein SY83_06020 [Paenibacillus swuensis]|uniref:Uncharacterized protein n=1 Tax=Paenibacillus swuensis TaxID=1178515 RepID=A0A172TFY5_9BACL|nr:hypothetical protein SY83_06020 [Paenibacillus swuensis]
MKWIHVVPPGFWLLEPYPKYSILNLPIIYQGMKKAGTLKESRFIIRKQLEYFNLVEVDAKFSKLICGNAKCY